jgi:glycosyltransferase involved in cell wall biosynthesis
MNAVLRPNFGPSAGNEIDTPEPVVAVLVPCFDEAATIARVVDDFRRALPSANIYVCDNNSTDDTSERAHQAGAVVLSEPLQGKGNVVRRLFADIEADIYILVDGDDTYDATAAPLLIDRLIDGRLDMVNGARVSEDTRAYRAGHRLGNRLLTGMVATIFGNRLSDMLSGYRVMSRRFVKSFPCLTKGFEIETELTVHALELRMPIAEVPTHYKHRPDGSSSKLHTIRDGLRILRTIVTLVQVERPLKFFALAFMALAAGSLVLAWPLLQTFRDTGLVPRMPTAVLSTGMMLLSFLSLACGLVMETVTRGRLETKRMVYLAIPIVRGSSF